MFDLHDIMNEPNPEASPEHRLGMAIHRAFAELDEIMALGADPETAHLVKREAIAMAQLQSRIQLINSFIQVQSKPGQLRVISNG